MRVLKKFNIIIFLLTFKILDIHSLQAAEEHLVKNSHTHIEKVNDNFYVGKMLNNSHLTFVMERITNENFDLWNNYINVQNDYHAMTNVIVGAKAVEKEKKHSMLSQIKKASDVFKAVLQEAFPANEIWIAYITKAKNPSIIPKSMKNYNVDQMKMNANEFAKDIEMFVTVTSSPQALITSHMGISRSLESFLEHSAGTKGVSIKLHAFAAKVMLMLNPERKYMINTPVNIMRKIIVDALPEKVFVGTKEDKEKKDLIDNDLLELMKGNPPILSTDGKDNLDHSLIIFDKNIPDKIWLNIKKTDEKYNWMFTGVFKPTSTTHYLVVDLNALAKSWD